MTRKEYLDNREIKLKQLAKTKLPENMRIVPGYRGRIVDDKGHVFTSLLGRIDSKRPIRLLSQTHSPEGYKVVSAWNEDKEYIDEDGHIQSSRAEFVHRLVWFAFRGEIPEGFEVDHIDKNRSNNDISNLRLLSISANRAFGEFATLERSLSRQKLYTNHPSLRKKMIDHLKKSNAIFLKLMQNPEYKFEHCKKISEGKKAAKHEEN